MVAVEVERELKDCPPSKHRPSQPSQALDMAPSSGSVSTQPVGRKRSVRSRDRTRKRRSEEERESEGIRRAKLKGGTRKR
eukprot:2808823-Pleurochrysis_carterae.AAC.5